MGEPCNRNTRAVRLNNSFFFPLARDTRGVTVDLANIETAVDTARIIEYGFKKPGSRESRPVLRWRRATGASESRPTRIIDNGTRIDTTAICWPEKVSLSSRSLERLLYTRTVINEYYESDVNRRVECSCEIYIKICRNLHEIILKTMQIFNFIFHFCQIYF